MQGLQGQLVCAGQVKSWKDMHDQAQKYNAQLQQYNGKLQDDMQASATALRDAQVASTPMLVGLTSSRGMC